MSTLAQSQGLQEDVAGLHPHVDYLDALVDGIDVSNDIDPSDLQRGVRDIKDRHSQLENEVGELLSNMETGSSIVGQFQVKSHSMHPSP